MIVFFYKIVQDFQAYTVIYFMYLKTVHDIFSKVLYKCGHADLDHWLSKCLEFCNWLQIAYFCL